MSASLENNMDKMANAMSRVHDFEHTFTIQGEKNTGVFTVKVPSVMERVNIGVKRAKMLNGAPQVSLDKFTDDITYMVAYLDTVITKRPPWFDFDKLDDATELSSLFWEASKWINSFQRGNEGNPNGADSQPTADEEDMAGDETVSGAHRTPIHSKSN